MQANFLARTSSALFGFSVLSLLTSIGMALWIDVSFDGHVNYIPHAPSVVMLVVSLTAMVPVIIYHRWVLVRLRRSLWRESSVAIRNAGLIRDLQAARTQLEAVLEGAGLGSWDWDLTSNAVAYDRRWCELVGLDPATTPMELATWDRLVHPDDKEAAYGDIQAHLSGQTEVYENIHRMRHANGSWVWILDRGRISERDEDGKPTRFSGTHLDITQYKEREILDGEIQKIGRIGGWELDVATMKTRWTEETYRLHKVPVGTPTDKLMGISFYAPHEQSKIMKHVEECLKGIP